MKIGITAGSYTRYGISEGARRARAHGYDCFDFGGFIHTETDFFRLPEAEFKADLTHQRELIEAEGIQIWQAHAPWCCPERDLTPEGRAEQLRCYLKAVRGAGYLGATHFVIHAIMPFGMNSPEDPKLMRDINAEFMGRLADEAREYGVKHIDVENLPFPLLPINHTRQCLDFAKRMNQETNSDIFKVCLDTGHSNFCGENPADAVRMLGKQYLGALHVHDNNGKADQHFTPGNGSIDWVDFSNALAEIGFDGCLSYETAVSNEIPEGEQRDRLEKELAQYGHRLAKNN
ncbi:MAG: sugar phosphate isomerase/epimerase [Clostridia bacterium]|nr:sugar phosphate isomerase/epimerase [Clostridia bacterium]